MPQATASAPQCSSPPLQPPPPSAIDKASKAPLHNLLQRLNLPTPTYEVITHTTYSVNVILPTGVRDYLAVPESGDKDLLQAWDKPSRTSCNGSGGVWKGRAFKHRRDAMQKSMETVMAKLGPWEAKRTAIAVKRREWRVQKRERKNAKRAKKSGGAEKRAGHGAKIERGEREEQGGRLKMEQCDRDGKAQQRCR